MKLFRRSLSVILFLSFIAAATEAQTDRLRVDHTVKIASIEEHLFHVTTRVKNIDQPVLELSLPTWTPGWYTIENYAKNILRFTIQDERGVKLAHVLTGKQRWRVPTAGLKEIKIEFDYNAEVLALNQAKIANDFAFFTGTELFLMAEGHRNAPSEVKFEAPQGWNIVSSLKETSNPLVFSAPDYDSLVDSTTEIGHFDVTRFEVLAKPHYFVSTPAGAFSKSKAEAFTKMLAMVAKTESAIFGSLPYEKYLYLYFFAKPESNAGGALEHANSHVAFAGNGQTAEAGDMAGFAAHEFFHLWNVKRIRPAEMWPYDYSRENETPSLWVSEGFTNYYADVAMYRCGFRSAAEFLKGVADAVAGVEGNPARAYISPADSSTSTWLGYDTPTAFGISYYIQGQNLGALLDLSIRNDSMGSSGGSSGGSSSLDDVMRTLYRDYYERGKGFTTEDLIGIINKLTSRDYHEFFRRYVFGVERPDYDRILGYAGYKVEKNTNRVPVFGFDWSPAQEGLEITGIEPGGSAAQAGLVPGDIVIGIDGLELRRGLQGTRERLTEKIGQTVQVTIRRSGASKNLSMKVGSREEEAYRLVEAPDATAAQLKIRAGWLKRD